jgi:carbonic anhydrase
MYFSRFALASAIALPLVSGATGFFSYDPEHEYGPDNWYNLAIDGNVCDGKKNSPIAVETHGCDRFEDYSFVVSCHIVSSAWLFGRNMSHFNLFVLAVS